jgi:hypothetical protein
MDSANLDNWLTDSDPVIFVSDHQDGNLKLLFFKFFFAYYFLQLYLHNFSKKKSHTEVSKHKQ